MKKLKSAAAFLLCFIIIFSSEIISTSASVKRFYHFTASKAQLTHEYKPDIGPKTDGYAIEYYYFSPVGRKPPYDVEKKNSSSSNAEETKENSENTSQSFEDESLSEEITEELSEEKSSEEISAEQTTEEISSEEKSDEETTEETSSEATTEKPTEQETETEDNKKYPVVFMFFGRGENENNGDQLVINNLYKWSSYELQQRFSGSHGAFIVTMKAPGSGVEWSESLCRTAKAAIDYFINKNSANIDRNRIYIFGNCIGGSFAQSMLSHYSDFFAAGIIMSPFYSPNETEVKNFKNIPVWIISNKKDSIAPYYKNVSPLISLLKQYSTVKEKSRVSVQTTDTVDQNGDKIVSTDLNHRVWYMAAYDMFMPSDLSPWVGTVTENLNGDKVELTYPNGIISWLSSNSKEGSESTSNSGSSAAKKRSFWEKISDFFKKIIYFFKGLFR